MTLSLGNWGWAYNSGRNLDINKIRFSHLHYMLQYSFWFEYESGNFKHFTGIWKRFKVTAWGPLPWSRYANTTLNHDKVSIYCALLIPQWKQSLRSTFTQVGDTWSLKCSIAKLDKQNRKFAPIVIIIEAKHAHFFVCKRTGFAHQELKDIVKITLIRVIDCDSSRVILWKTWLESNHHFSQRDSSWVRVTTNHDSSRVIDSSHAITGNRFYRTLSA